MTPFAPSRRGRQRVLLALATLGILLLVTGTRNVYTGYDSRGVLLVSESLLRQGTPRLDAYGDQLSTFTYRVQERGGHRYYVFPLGTSLLSVPAVAVADVLGLEMVESGDESRVQILLAALTVAGTFLLIFALATAYLPFAWALGYALTFVLGSSLVSTMGTALWSFNYTVVLTLACLVLLHGPWLRRGATQPGILGLLLFTAFLCRPTAAIFIALVLVYLLARERRLFLGAVLGAGLPFLVLVVFSWREFGQPLPDYYLPRRIADTGSFWTAVYGNLLSPARGILIFSPFLGVIAVAAVFLARGIVRRTWFWLGLLWFTLHLVSISRFPHWWAGHSYGSRLATDALPALVLSGLVILQTGLARWSTSARRAWTRALGIAAVLSVLLNTVQGLYNVHTRQWNALPDVDHNTRYLFDWRFPQFLATEARNERKLDHHRARFGIPASGVMADEEGLEYTTGWYSREAWGRWAIARHATFRAPVPEGAAVLVIRATSWPGRNKPQIVRVLAGARTLGEFEVDGPSWAWRDFRIPLPKDLGPGPVSFQLEMAELWIDPKRPQRPLALPVQGIRIDDFVYTGPHGSYPDT